MLSPVDTAVICGLALLLFGPKKLPEIGRAIGQGLGNFKKAVTEAQDEVKTALDTDKKAPAPPATPAPTISSTPTATAEEENKPG
jgi:sec-independent protein translocase protein TatA